MLLYQEFWRNYNNENGKTVGFPAKMTNPPKKGDEPSAVSRVCCFRVPLIPRPYPPGRAAAPPRTPPAPAPAPFCRGGCVPASDRISPTGPDAGPWCVYSFPWCASRHVAVVAAEQHHRHLAAMPLLRAGILGILQQTVPVALVGVAALLRQTPGTMRHRQSASAMAGISPPVTTKSPMEISSSTHSSRNR